jgi:glycerol uptake facilitator-like aquaporin
MFVVLFLGIVNLSSKDSTTNAIAIALSYYFAHKLSADSTGGALNPTLGLF